MEESSDPKLMVSTRAHLAGLKRLSERANSTPAAFSPRKVSFSFTGYGSGVIEQLKSYGVRIDPGLTDEELERVQATFQFTFPPDLRGILQQGLPLGPGFPDWRSHLGTQKLRLRVSMPKSGICSDTELGLFWWRGWGPRPSDPEAAVRLARAELRKVPVLIPVFGSCYVPAFPVRAGNPILFVERSEAYYCARELSELFSKSCLRLFLMNSIYSGTSYYPEPVSVHESCRFSGGVKQMIARCSSKEESTNSWGRSLDALAIERRSSSVSYRSVLNWSRSSDGSSCEGESTPRIRRIEFWSDLVERSHTMNRRQEWEFYEDDATDVQRTVQEAVQDIVTKLRNAGWNEKDIAEIVDSDEAVRNSGTSVRRAGDRESVLEGLAHKLDYMSACMREAGWSLNDVTESLCFDLTGFSEHPRSRSKVRISPEVASRIGVLAAFVAQG